MTIRSEALKRHYFIRPLGGLPEPVDVETYVRHRLYCDVEGVPYLTLVRDPNVMLIVGSTDN